MALEELLIIGYQDILLEENSMWNYFLLHLSLCKLYVEYHRDQSWAQYYFWGILIIFVMSLQILNICNTINKNLEELQTWFIFYKLSLSIEKTNHMIFSNKRIDKSDIFIKIDQKLIKQVMITKFLGVMIDSHLQWKEHINFVNLKFSKCIAIMHKLIEIFTVNTIKQLYNSFVFSIY